MIEVAKKSRDWDEKVTDLRKKTIGEVSPSVETEEKLTKLDKRQALAFVESNYSQRLRYNVRTSQIELDGKRCQTSKFHLHLVEKDGINIGKGLAKDICEMVAERNQYDPIG